MPMCVVRATYTEPSPLDDDSGLRNRSGSEFVYILSSLVYIFCSSLV